MSSDHKGTSIGTANNHHRSLGRASSVTARSSKSLSLSFSPIPPITLRYTVPLLSRLRMFHFGIPRVNGNNQLELISIWISPMCRAFRLSGSARGLKSSCLYILHEKLRYQIHLSQNHPRFVKCTPWSSGYTSSHLHNRPLVCWACYYRGNEPGDLQGPFELSSSLDWIAKT